MKVGFIGLGRMGAHMASNLAASGVELMLWNRTMAKAEQLGQQLDVPVAASPKALADQCQIVISMLADDPSSERVHYGEAGLFAGQALQLSVPMGTLSPQHIHALCNDSPTGVAVVDAPVSGATQAAQQAQLMIMAGCQPAQFAAVDALFSIMGKHTVFLGEAGRAAVMKLAINSMIHGLNQSLSEAMILTESAGIDARDAFNAIEHSAACAPMLSYRKPLYLDEANHDVTFTVALAEKDMRLAMALADDAGLNQPLGAATLAQLIEANAAGFGARDMASILNFMRAKS